VASRLISVSLLVQASCEQVGCDSCSTRYLHPYVPDAASHPDPELGIFQANPSYFLTIMSPTAWRSIPALDFGVVCRRPTKITILPHHPISHHLIPTPISKYLVYSHLALAQNSESWPPPRHRSRATPPGLMVSISIHLPYLMADMASQLELHNLNTLRFLL
jgi:hypothetical protein